MILFRRIGGGCPFCYRLFYPVVLFLFLIGFSSSLQAEDPPYQVEIRVTDQSTLQLLNNRGKICQNLSRGIVRKRVAVDETQLLASFGEDSQHHSIIMLSMDISANQPVGFLFGKNIIIASPEAILTLHLSPDHSMVQVSPSLMGKIWINGSLLPRGDTRKLPLNSSTREQNPEGEIIPSPDQPKPLPKDFRSIPTPSL
jgi:hypothetical protein